MKAFWQRDGKNTLATGATRILHEIPSDEKLYFGGCSFRKRSGKDEAWKEFPDTLFFTPEQIEENVTIPALSLPHILKRDDFPDFSGWKKKIGRALESKHLGKVVLARRTTVHFDTKVDPWALVHHLQPRAKWGTLFLFQIAPDIAFIGLTPERLYQREGKKIWADALAGTRPREKEDELLGAEKEGREFGFVKQFVQAQLSPLCLSCQWNPSDGILHTATLAHLHNQLHGLLKDDVTDHTLISTLHPTPAIGGHPRQEALAFLHEEEPFERGWYSAPLGWISPQRADMAVAIRSALIRGKEVHLFAGVGIVQGSDPKKEWEELNMKVLL